MGRVNLEDVVEFGKAYDVPTTLIAASDDSVSAAYAMAVKDYFKAKNENFPGYEGLPEIKVSTSDPLKRLVKIGWYVAVPKTFVIEPDQIQEDLLWDS